MRINSDEKYVLDLLSEILKDEFQWQKRFDGLLGDPGKSGRQTKLPVDAYFPNRKLIVEYRERQHYKSTPIMDNRMTISGVPRGMQRKLYDCRKEDWAKKNNYNFLAISYENLFHNRNGRLKRDKEKDLLILELMIKPFL